MSSDSPRESKGGRFQFSLRRMFLFLTVVACALYVWLAITYEPETQKFPLYEKAPSTRGLAIRVGPNLMQIRLVARNQLDGSLVVEDGHGRSLQEAKAKKPHLLTKAATWLDVVQVEIEPGPELLDILEVRIFDHETRTLLSDVHEYFGWQVIEPNLVQLYGLGKKLPAKVDIWLRVQSYAENKLVTKLMPMIGSTCQLPSGTLILKDIRSGSWAYDSRKGKGLHRRLGNSSDQVATVVEYQGVGRTNDYQISAVSHDGTKSHPSSPHFLRFQPEKTIPEKIDFHMPLAEIDHFEVRPFGGRHRFFFEAVQLPSVSKKTFMPSPVANIAIAGEQTTTDIRDFAPLTARLSTYRGNWADGVEGMEGWISVSPRMGGSRNLESEFTIVYKMCGLGHVSWQFRFEDSATGNMTTESESSRHGQSSVSAASMQGGYRSYRKPLKEVKSMEVTLQPTP